jgi:hypothetical protein
MVSFGFEVIGVVVVKKKDIYIYTFNINFFIGGYEW